MGNDILIAGLMALGSVVWGALAERASPPAALAVAALALVLGLVAARRWRVQSGEALDLTPSGQWPEPFALVAPPADEGPVLVTVEYWVAPERLAEFAAAMQALAAERRRDGAMQYGLYYDPADLGRCLETFVVES